MAERHDYAADKKIEASIEPLRFLSRQFLKFKPNSAAWLFGGLAVMRSHPRF